MPIFMALMVVGIILVCVAYFISPPIPPILSKVMMCLGVIFLLVGIIAMCLIIFGVSCGRLCA